MIELKKIVALSLATCSYLNAVDISGGIVEDIAGITEKSVDLFHNLFSPTKPSI